MRVAVIGAGAAGLAAMRHLVSRAGFEATAFEMTDRVGGTWVYSEDTGLDQHGLPIQSSIYSNLRANLPKEVMAFPDFPFRDDLPSFVSHEDVLEYLQSYAEHFKLLEHIRFNTLVEKVSPVVSNVGTRWQVQVKSLQKRSPPEVMEVDGVIVANGHYAVPLLPELSGLDRFSGKVMHSHYYRHPENFKNQVVLCLGAGPSGLDISIDLSKFAKKVYLAHRKARLTTPFPSNVIQCCSIKEVLEKGAVMQNGSVLEFDVLLLCTGYRFRFPFLEGTVDLQTEGEWVRPLYKHVLHTDYPNLSFIGLCKKIVPFPQFHCQVQFALAALEGSVSLPSSQSMVAEAEDDFQLTRSLGLPPHHTHILGSRQWPYNDELATLADFQPLPKVYQKMYEFVSQKRIENVLKYQELNLKVVSDEDFTLC